MSRMLLACGVIAGPLYVLVAAAQIFARDGFDITRHAVSLLSLGDLGWIQITNFVVVGLLVIALAFGLRLELAGGPGSTWGPMMLAVFGLGLVASGVFVADPMDGFPPGTPVGDPVVVTWHGVAHFFAGGIAFLALISACFIFARRFAALDRSGWATFSGAIGAFYFVAFVLIAAAPGRPATNLLLTLAVVLGWIWLSAIAARYWSLAGAGATRPARTS